MGLVLGTAAGADEKKSESKKAAVKKETVILTETTASRIPQRVVISNQQVNSGQPMIIVKGQELNRTGATSVAGMINDPNIFTSRRIP